MLSVISLLLLGIAKEDFLLDSGLGKRLFDGTGCPLNFCTFLAIIVAAR